MEKFNLILLKICQWWLRFEFELASNEGKLLIEKKKIKPKN